MSAKPKLWQDFKLPEIDVASITLGDLCSSHGMHPITFDPTHDLEEKLHLFYDFIDKQQHIKGIRLMQDTINDPAYSRVFGLYRIIARRCDAESLRQECEKQAQSIVNQLITLHLKECSILRSYNYKDCEKTWSGGLIVNSGSDDDYKSIEYLRNIQNDCKIDKHCIVCERGSVLFHHYVDDRLNQAVTHRYLTCVQKQTDQWIWDNMNLMGHVFEYCPFHMDRTNDDDDDDDDELTSREIELLSNHSSYYTGPISIYLRVSQIEMYFESVFSWINLHSFGNKNELQVTKIAQIGQFILPTIIMALKSSEHTAKYDGLMKMNTLIENVAFNPPQSFLFICVAMYDLGGKYENICRQFCDDYYVLNEKFKFESFEIVDLDSTNEDSRRILHVDTFTCHYPIEKLQMIHSGEALKSTCNNSGDKRLKELCQSFEKYTLLSNDERVVTRALNRAESKSNTLPFWPPPEHCYVLSFKFRKHHKANSMFNQCFERMNNQLTQRDNGTMHMGGPIFYTVPFIWYSMFLFNNKSQNACKYFEYCLTQRPFNQGIRHYYSLYLRQVIQNYQSSYVQLKLTKTLRDGRSTKEYRKELKVLFKKMKKHHRCNNSSCCKILAKKASGRRVCKACKSANYCNKLCQKRDWRVKHRYECIAIYSKKLTSKQIKNLKAYSYVLNQWFDGSR